MRRDQQRLGEFQKDIWSMIPGARLMVDVARGTVSAPADPLTSETALAR
ncbi:MAG TPA: hypothetical protein VNY05_02950 [Candidatus Acidoferrales bacterium]|jgi:hypothetical protein|nr:hypothetical protein [Candidatus Acidoferrales bacterium]